MGQQSTVQLQKQLKEEEAAKSGAGHVEGVSWD